MPHVTREEVKQVFEKWEADFRESPDGFLNAEETAAMEVADLSEQRAIHFMALLRSLST